MTEAWRPTWDYLLSARPPLTARQAAKIMGRSANAARDAARKRGKKWAPGWDSQAMNAARARGVAKSGVPITIHGVEYPTIRSAARALGLAHGTLYYLRHHGRLERAGTGRGGYKRVPVVVLGVRYASLSEAARALDMPRSSLALAHKEGRLDAIVKARRPSKATVTFRSAASTSNAGKEHRISLPAMPWDAAAPAAADATGGA